MAEEIKQNKKMEKKENKVEEKKMETKTEIKTENKVETKTSETKTETKKEEPKKISKKDEAVVNASGLGASLKQCMAIGDFIKGKSIDKAIADLNEVIKFKRAVPMTGEYPHRKGAIMSGRYPIKASEIVIGVLKGLKGNSMVNGLDLARTKIYFASASWASRPARGGGKKAKRTNFVIKAKEFEGGKK